MFSLHPNCAAFKSEMAADTVRQQHNAYSLTHDTCQAAKDGQSYMWALSVQTIQLIWESSFYIRISFAYK